MENKNVGWLVIGISFVVGIIIWLFNVGLKKIVGQTCSHGPSCTMYDTIGLQTKISLAIAGIIFIIGLVIMLQKPKEKLVVKTIKEKRKPVSLEGLDSDEKKVVKHLRDENGAVFQSTLMEKTEIGKVKMTRLLDKLEAKQIIERKRRGMNNIVVLK